MRETGQHRETVADIESSIGAIIGAALGREPGRVEIVGCEPLLTVVVSDSRTPLEGALLDAGAGELVRRERDALREALEDPLRAAVERAIGVSVDGLSGSHDPPSGTETLLFDVHGSPQLLN